ncbi:hypothetical protein PR003_g20426 [Phytophthora rubi]|uniref:RxLR effector protein n=1 Tax=Phytophthora rubi TaxID=129364 RepID=A0A6A4DQZ5_9STRA|nr:hypothetical protein PR003_g20426 [Phytophthora rubi]
MIFMKQAVRALTLPLALTLMARAAEFEDEGDS